MRDEYYLKHRYIWIGVEFPRVVGRVFGGDGAASYQIAARPYDEPAVHGHANIQEAYEAALKVLNERQGR